MHRNNPHEERILVCAPHGRDAEVMATVLRRDGLDCELVAGFAGLGAAIAQGAGAAIVAEEAMH
ncbi:hybrid sensor histidine kinase/response regulator, partial [Acinetobacter baumannii]|nr:hybrid sensor histidine kinase/response regulator [Acinetobacter baumannii]